MKSILHIMTHSPYTIRYVSFIYNFFSSDKHEFIIYYNNKDDDKEYDLSNRVTLTNDKRLYKNFRVEIEKADLIIVHQLNHPLFLLELMFLAPRIFNKLAWVLWGGDVYYAQYNNTIKSKLIEILRKRVIKKIPLIISYIEGDFQVVKELYGSKAKYIKADYPSPIDILKIEKIDININENEDRIIILGNSADPSNDHCEAIDILSKYKDECMLVKCVLSYGGDEEYKNKVIRYGEEKLGGKFMPILKYQSFDEYLNMINLSDICILNHKRQQGLGNQKVFLALMKKLYISNRTTPFSYFKSIDISIEATETILGLDFNDFTRSNNEVLVRNRVNILNDMSTETLCKDWDSVFSYDFG